MTIRELCEKEVVQLEQGVCLGRADDLTFDPATARLQSLILLGRPRLFGLLGRDDSLTIPWQEIETIGTDAVLVHTALPEAPPQPEQLKWWQKLRVKLGLKKKKKNRVDFFVEVTIIIAEALCKKRKEMCFCV